METRRLVKTKGIVLSEVNFSESDKMLTVLTPDLGKISCVAKGARKMQSTLLATSQMFAFSEMVLYRGRGENYYINSAELIEPFYSIRTDYERLECAMNCVKFVRRYVQENQMSVYVLKLLLNTIYLLSVSEKNKELIKSVFELKAVCLFGFKPNFNGCVECGERNVTGFSVKKGGLICKGCSCLDKGVISLSEGAVTAIRYIIQSDLKKLFSFEVSESVLAEIKYFNNIYIKDKLE